MIWYETHATAIKSLEVKSDLIILLGSLSDNIILRTGWKGKCVHVYKRLRGRETEWETEKEDMRETRGNSTDQKEM